MKGAIVLKVGTKNLMCGGLLHQDVFNEIARQVVVVEREEKKVVIVTSGAIKAGEERLIDLDKDFKNLSKKDLAGVGARHLLNRWGEAFNPYHKEISQFWLTYANWRNSDELERIKVGIPNCLDNGLVPVINENDVISDSEILFMEKGISENDRLARMVAKLISAEAVLFLTDAGGVYEDDPRTNPKARMYEEINPFTFEPRKLSEVSEWGRGGIRIKIQEAKLCFLASMKVAIAGMEEDVLIKFSRGEKVGTTLSKFSRFK